MNSDAIWTHRTHGHPPTTLFRLPDCPITDHDTSQACSEFAGHPGVHTY